MTGCYFLPVRALRLAHRAFIAFEILALAAALILRFFRGAAWLTVPDWPPVIRFNSFCRPSIFSRIETARLSCWTESSAKGFSVMTIE